ncbi:MAG TPA: methyltransferase domain-containing protein [Acidimicrobiales bacterium]|nr:methyltransferase domain-containing protein [Acidimicrobiales bacterium]
MTDRDHWFEDVADHLGAAYLRYSFTKGTEQEVGFLVDALGLEPGMSVLDVGCGPGRHALALARRGIDVTGIDISQRFVDLANEAAEVMTAGNPPSDADASGAEAGVEAGRATFERRDARHLDYDSDFDAAISLCQGAFGLAGGPAASSLDPDVSVLAGIARAVRPGGMVALSAFSAYFQVRFLESTDDFDAASGVNHERTTIRSEEGVDTETELWTTCFTPRELRLLCASVGLTVRDLWSVSTGRYAEQPADIDHPEFLVVASRG